MIRTGQKAPDFIAPMLADGKGEVVELFSVVDESDAVVLLFVPADFVPACTAELCAVRDAGWHANPGVSVLAITGDSLYSHAAYGERYSLSFPLVSDFHGGLSEQYGLRMDEWEGHSAIPARATVVIDGDWEVVAVERDDPLAEQSPAPVERATPSVERLVPGIDEPTVDYGDYGI